MFLFIYYTKFISFEGNRLTNAKKKSEIENKAMVNEWNEYMRRGVWLNKLLYFFPASVTRPENKNLAINSFQFRRRGLT